VTRILVTGASGFVGLPLLDQLAGRGHDLHALSAHRPEGAREGVRWWQCDLGEPAAVGRLLEQLQPEQLVHLAWYVEPGRFWHSAENVVWVERSLALLRAFALAGGRRAVCVGTCAEYDWSASSEPFDELRSPLAPATLYGTAKDALRRLAAAYAELEQIELAWGRLFFLYGPREAPTRLVPAVINALLAGQPAETTAGRQRRDFLHVEDVAGALAALLDSSLTGPINIASGQAVPIAEVVELIAAAIGRPELLRRGALPDRADEPALLAANATRLREEVGYRPRWSLEEGLADTVAWWRDQRGPAGAR
jgi:nucleoside-diphosphate-sugar epimerase